MSTNVKTRKIFIYTLIRYVESLKKMTFVASGLYYPNTGCSSGTFGLKTKQDFNFKNLLAINVVVHDCECLKLRKTLKCFLSKDLDTKVTSPVLTHETCETTLVRQALINKKQSYHLQKQRALSAVATVHSAHFLFVWCLLLAARLV